MVALAASTIGFPSAVAVWSWVRDVVGGPSRGRERVSDRSAFPQELPGGRGPARRPSASVARAEAAQARLRGGADIVTLGETGVKTSFLALGTGMNGGHRASDLTRLGQAEFTRIVRHGLD